MSIRKRIFVATIVLFTLFVVREIVGYVGNRTVIEKSANAYMFKDATTNLQGIYRGLNEFIIDEGEPLSLELTRKYIKESELAFEHLRNDLTDRQYQKILVESIEPQWQKVRTGVIDFLAMSDISVEDDDAMIRYGQLAVEGNTLLRDVETLAEKTKEIAAKTAERTKLIVGLVAVSIMVFLALLLFTLYKSITRPIGELIGTAQKFGEGNFNVSMDQHRTDEFGTVASHFNVAIDKLNAMLLNVKDVTGTLAANSSQVSSSADQIVKNADEQSSQTAHVGVAMEELNSSFLDVARNTSNASDSAKEASDLASQGGMIVSEAIDGMQRIAGSVTESATTIEALGQRSVQIGEIIDVINDIAEQTNLLALNAAIEAARAGEQGRGFAVVADEVRKLAERTTSATNQIGGMIKGFQEDITKAVDSMQTGTKEVEAGVNLSHQAGESLQKIVESARSVTDMVSQIAIAAEEQSSTGDQINSHIEQVTRLTEHNARNAKQSSSAVHNMIDLVRKLEDLVNEFRLKHEVSAIGDRGVENRPQQPDQEKFAERGVPAHV